MENFLWLLIRLLKDTVICTHSIMIKQGERIPDLCAWFKNLISLLYIYAQVRKQLGILMTPILFSPSIVSGSVLYESHLSSVLTWIRVGNWWQGNYFLGFVIFSLSLSHTQCCDCLKIHTTLSLSFWLHNNATFTFTSWRRKIWVGGVEIFSDFPIFSFWRCLAHFLY